MVEVVDRWYIRWLDRFTGRYSPFSDERWNIKDYDYGLARKEAYENVLNRIRSKFGENAGGIVIRRKKFRNLRPAYVCIVNAYVSLEPVPEEQDTSAKLV